MRRSATWMCQLDERILECLSEESYSTAGAMARRFAGRASAARIRERCDVLLAAGLLATVGVRGHYELTVWGERYLAGELDARHRIDRATGP